MRFLAQRACKKCGKRHGHSTSYRHSTDMIWRRCSRCGYTWNEEPITRDPRDDREEQAKKELSEQDGRPEMTFYDVRTQRKFKSSDWRVEKKQKAHNDILYIRYFAVAEHPVHENECWRIISNKKTAERWME